MDYEKYNNALEKAKVRYNEIKDTDCSEEKFLLDLFPELQESEDEKIRKALIDYFDDAIKADVNPLQGYGTHPNKVIDWLEKQKAMDKDIIFRPLVGTDIIAAANQALEKIEIGKEVVLAFNGAYIPVNGKTVAEICNEYFAWTEKQGEKKVSSVDFKAKDWYVSNVDGKIHDMTYNPTNKVEPKFKVGDVMRTLQEAADGMVDGMPVVISIDKEYYHCTNELIAIKDQDDYEFPPINVKQKSTWSEDDERIVTALMEGFRYHQLFNPRFGEVPNAEIISWIKSLKERLS